MSKSTASTVAEKAPLCPFSLATDGSNDGGAEQLYPVWLNYYDDGEGKGVQSLLSLPALTDGNSTGENIQVTKSGTSKRKNYLG